MDRSFSTLHDQPLKPLRSIECRYCQNSKFRQVNQAPTPHHSTSNQPIAKKQLMSTFLRYLSVCVLISLCFSLSYIYLFIFLFAFYRPSSPKQQGSSEVRLTSYLWTYLHVRFYFNILSIGCCSAISTT